MKLLAGLLCSSLLVLSYGQDGYNQRFDDGQGRIYERSQTRSENPVTGANIVREDSSYIDSSVNREGADFTGAYNYHIGHQGKKKPNQTGPTDDSYEQKNQDYQGTVRTRLFEHGSSGPTERPRIFDPDFDVKIQEKMAQSGVEVQHQPSGPVVSLRDGSTGSSLTVNIDDRGNRDVEVKQPEQEQKRGSYSAGVYYSNEHKHDEFINMDRAQFQNAHNFNIGHRGKRDVKVEKKGPEQEVIRQKRGYFSTDVSYSNDHRHDESINMNGAKFQGAHHFEIEHQRGKRDVETEKMNGEEQVVPREKRQYFNADVHLQNNYAHDESINMNGAQFQGANNFNIGHKRGKRDVETAEVQPSEQELSRQKRGYYNADVYYSNDHRTDKSINMERSQFTGAHHFNIGHKEKRDVESETAEFQPAEEELSRQKRGYFTTKVHINNGRYRDESINMQGAIFQGAHDFNIGHRGKRHYDAKYWDVTEKKTDNSINLQGVDFSGRSNFEIGGKRKNW